jgi:hypothetical protein
MISFIPVQTRFSPLIAALGLAVSSAVSVAQQPMGVSGAAPNGAAASAQEPSIFAPLTLGPAPSATRLANGAPGPKYWQNRADYVLHATLDTATGSVQGAMTLRYTNNSPHTLDVIWVQYEQNRFRRQGASFGHIAHSFTQISNNQSVSLQVEENGAVAKVILAEPLKPGKTAILQTTWHFVVPRGGNRMGRDGALYQIAQWYPRVAVYDDVKGWNTEPYLGAGEFYTEYGDYTLEVTVPANYIVAATGTLTNPTDVLTPTQITRLEAAAKADTVVRVITTDELSSGAARPKQEGMLTWKFHSKNVRDAVWCAAPNYLWDATSWKGIVAHAYYRPAAAAWRDAADMTRFSVKEYSERWDFMYPYPQMSAVEGPEGGMEYPMLTMVAPYPNTAQLYNVISHEVGHIWFPMIVGSNERVHPWMDEGINQFINTFSDASRHPEGGSQAARALNYVRGIDRFIQTNQDAVMDIPADNMGGALGYLAYFKPAGVMEILRRDILGPEVFDKALKVYLRRWAYKHPTPVDFFRTMEDVSKQKLDWFWRQFFYEAPKFDQAIGTVTQNEEGGTTRVVVEYVNHARGVLPIFARFTFSDGSKEDFTYPVEVWKKGASYTVSYTFKGKTVQSITLDPERRSLDTNRSNNSWTAQVE